MSVVLLLVIMLVVHNIVRSRYGLALVATRDNEVAAAASGVNVALVKTLSFGVSGAITGVGGCLFAIYLGSLVAHDSFTLLNAVALLIGLVIGGQATRFGPIIGALAVVYIPYYTSDIGQGQAAAVLFGVVLIAIVFLAPEGVIGGFGRLMRRLLVVIPAVPPPFQPVKPPKPQEPDQS
jgi:branched-chain amino acid transport system permease protein